VEISLGDMESREAYRLVLRAYLEKNKKNLSPTSCQRLERGSVLRILDSKEQEDISIVNSPQCPQIHQCLTENAKTWWKSFLEGLSTVSIPYTINPHLVRGLDYYEHTCFEFTTLLLGTSQRLAVIAGGRYNGLVARLGGPQVPGVGWSLGMERIVEMVEKKISSPCYTAVIPIAESHTQQKSKSIEIEEVNLQVRAAAFSLCNKLRVAGVPTIFINNVESSDNENKRFFPLKRQLIQANKDGCRVAILLGMKELQTNTVLVKNLDTTTQEAIPKSYVIEYCQKLSALDTT